jgi:hypothetical protein
LRTATNNLGRTYDWPLLLLLLLLYAVTSLLIVI